MLEQEVKVPKWESELWHYISIGDGVQCPVYSTCRVRRGGGWCASDNKGLIEQLLDGSQFNPINYDFIAGVRPCRIFELVEELAQTIINKGRVQCPPVPAELASLADGQNPVEIRLVPLRFHRAAIWRLKDGWVIQLNVNDTPNARRFSLFHEVFHILAHCRAAPVFRKRNNEACFFNELLADYFASCVLMPREWVKQTWAEVENLDRVAQIFDVTEEAMWVRLKVVGLTANSPSPSPILLS